MIMESCRWFIGVSEIASVLLGLFIYTVFTALSKVPLLPKETFIEESKHFHY
jgi:hypothetical protein